MHRVIGRKSLLNTVGKFRVGIIPARFLLDKIESVWTIPIDLARRHVDKWRFRTASPRGFQKIQRSHGIDIEVVVGARSRQVVTRLGRGVDDRVGSQFGNELKNRSSIANIGLMMAEIAPGTEQAFPIPVGVALGAEKG